jgi:hypothetical protein
MPFHSDPSLELNPDNFITLCMNKLECHEKIGHGGNFKLYNPHVKEDAAILKGHLELFDKVAAEDKLKALPNKPTE